MNNMNQWGRYGQRLKRARKKLGWSQDRLARYFDLTQTAIGKYENRQRTPDESILINRIRLFVKSVERATERELKSGTLQYRKHKFDLSRGCLISREKKARFPSNVVIAKKPKCLKSRGDFARKKDFSDFSGFSIPRGFVAPPIMCAYCRCLRPDEEITVDDSLVAKYICEDCFRIEAVKRTHDLPRKAFEIKSSVP